MTTEDKAWPKKGDRLTHYSRKSGKTVEAEVLDVDKQTGRISVRVEGEVFPSLSSAAKDIVGHATNGWVYWGLKKQQYTRSPKQKP